MTEWSDYIEAVCLQDEKGVIPPLEVEYDPASETWDLYFEYEVYGEHDLVALPFESNEEAQKAIQEIEEKRQQVA